MRKLLALLLVLAALSGGCGSGTADIGAQDAAADVSGDAPTQTDTSTQIDTHLDAVPDAATPLDTATDTVADTAPDTATDTVMDAVTDADGGGARPCVTLADCLACELCVAGACVPPSEPACVVDGDCAEGWLCTADSGAPADPCRNRCAPPPECAGDDDCGPCQACLGGDCAVVTPAPCLTDDDCGRAERCEVAPAAPCENACVFVPECAVDGDCGPCEGCLDGLCETVLPPPCTTDGDCGAGFVCVVDVAAACLNACAPAPECLTDDDCGLCETCVAGACALSAPVPCAVDADCAEAERCEVDAAGPCRNRCAPDPGHPLNLFGAKYWTVYRPHFFATHYEDGRVCDRLEGGVKMWGDNTAFMGYALTAFVHEYRAYPNPETLAVLHRILQAVDELETLGGDPIDGYVVRADRGPDYESNWYSRNNEPSGDQYLSLLRGMRDVVLTPGPLVHDGVDLKELARNRAAWLVFRLKTNDWRLKNQLGQLVKRGDDQRWASWAFQRGAGAVSGLGAGVFESSWTVSVLGVPVSVGPSYQRAIAHQFINGCFAFTRACVSGRSIDLGLGFSVDVDCNEFNIGLGGDAGSISLSADPASPDWFSAVIDRDDIIAEGNAMWAMVARYQFNDGDPRLASTAANCFTAPPEPPRGDSGADDGWCRSWRWARDFDTPDLCTEHPYWLQSYSGLDYLLCRAMATANGEFLPASDWE